MTPAPQTMTVIETYPLIFESKLVISTDGKIYQVEILNHAGELMTLEYFDTKPTPTDFLTYFL